MNEFGKDDFSHMKRALELAATAGERGEVPVGCLVVRGEEILAEAGNDPISANDPTAHAEINALRLAARRAKNYRLSGATLYVTLEPCAMCAGAIVQARVDRVVYGADDPKAGAAGSVLSVLPNERLNHRPLVERGLLAEEASALLSDFFSRRRAEKAAL